MVSCRRVATVLHEDGDAVRKQYDFSKAVRGAVLAVPAGTTRITIRLDDDVIAWFHKQVNDAGGGNFHTLINRDPAQVQEPGLQGHSFVGVGAAEGWSHQQEDHARVRQGVPGYPTIRSICAVIRVSTSRWVRVRRAAAKRPDGDGRE